MEFDESKIISPLHTDEAEVGKRYYAADSLVNLKYYAENNNIAKGVITLAGKNEGDPYPFICTRDHQWQFLYPYKEPKRKRMTRVQFMEWLAKGNGLYKGQNNYAHFSYVEMVEMLDEEVGENYLIRPFGQTEWVIPTEEIFLRDCRS